MVDEPETTTSERDGEDDSAGDARAELVTEVRPAEPAEMDAAAMDAAVIAPPAASQIHQAAVSEVTGDEVRLVQSAAGSIRADDVTMVQSAAGFVRGDDVSLSMGGAALIAGEKVRVAQGGAQAIIATDSVSIEQGGAGVVVAGNVELHPQTLVGVVLAGNVSGEVRAIFDWRAALAFGGALGIVSGLVRRVARRKA